METVDIVLEAEDFSNTADTGWRIIQGDDSDLYGEAGNALSRNKCIHLPAGPSTASVSSVVTIPAGGIYRVWARYLYSSGCNSTFKIILKRGDLKVFDEHYGTKRGRKLCPSRKNRFRGAEGTGSGESGLVWEGHEKKVYLEAGTYAIEIHGVPGRSPAVDRNVDVVFLTSDMDIPQKEAAPFLDRLSRPGAVYLRVKRPVTATSPGYYEITARIMRFPYRRPEGYLSVTGLTRRAPPRISWMRPGESTPWIDISTYLDSTNETILCISEGGTRDNLKVNVEFSFDPKGRAQRRIAHSEEGNVLMILVPVELSDGRRILTVRDSANELKNHVASFAAEVGPPVHTRFYGGYIPEDISPHLYRTHFEIYHSLGLSGLGGLSRRIQELADYDLSPKADLICRVDQMNVRYLSNRFMDLKASGKLEYIDIVLMDEDCCLQPLYQAAFSKRNNLRFREWIEEENLEELLLPALDDIPASGQVGDTSGEDDAAGGGARGNDSTRNDDNTPAEQNPAASFSLCPREKNCTHPLLYYYSKKFHAILAGRDLREYAGDIGEFVPSEFRIGFTCDTSPDFRLDAGKWITPARVSGCNVCGGGVTLDQLREEGLQSASFYVDVLRCAAKYNDASIYFSIPSTTSGVSDRQFRSIAYLALGNGADYINFEHLGPGYFFPERFVRNRDRNRYRAVFDIIHEVAKADHYLHEGRRRPASIALLLSETTDIWQGASKNRKDHRWKPNIYDQERKCLYHTVRHLGYSIDFITEEDIESGGYLSDYSLLILAGDHITRKTARFISSWVEEGGTLLGIAGSGMYDEGDSKCDVLQKVFGITDSRMETVQCRFSLAHDLPQLRELDIVSCDPAGWSTKLPLTENDGGHHSASESKPDARGGDRASNHSGESLRFEALGALCHVVPERGVEVLGRFSKGEPAILHNQWGEGAAIHIGTLLGCQSIRHGMSDPPRAPASHGDAPFHPEIAALLRGIFHIGRVESEVIVSHPQVLASIIESPEGTVVTIVNTDPQPAGTVEVRIEDVAPPERVFSVLRGNVPYEYLAGTVDLEMHLADADMVVIPHR
jgi:hypothetical protein